MSWQSRSDPGLAIVAQVHDALKIADKWRMDEPRGFTWWASDFAQRVWSDQSVFHNTSAIYRLHAEIEFIRGKGHGAECALHLSRLMSCASLSALVHDGETDTFKLHCGIYASEENAEWLGRLFLGAVGIQISEAHGKASRLAAQLKGAPATSAHPATGMRSEPDPMCAAIERFFRPAGALPSRWADVEEWNEAHYNVKRLAEKVSTDSRSFLHAEFPWAAGAENGECITLEVTTQRPNPELGNGLHMSLKLPVRMDEEHSARTALDLNAAERQEWKWIHDLGSWCAEEGAVEFNCFIPNVSYHAAILPSLVHDMAIRANWASELAASEAAAAR